MLVGITMFSSTVAAFAQDASETVVSSISEIKALNEGTDFYFDASALKLNVYRMSGSSLIVCVSDNTGAMMMDDEYAMNLGDFMEGGDTPVEGYTITALIRGKYKKDSDGNPTIFISDYTGYLSEYFTQTVGTSTVQTAYSLYQLLNSNDNLMYNYVSLSDTYMTTTGNFTSGVVASDGSDKITLYDKFACYNDDSYTVPSEITGFQGVLILKNNTPVILLADKESLTEFKESTASSIADMKALPSETEVTLSLKNAVVTKLFNYGNFLCVDDGTGAMVIDQGLASNLDIYSMAEGSVLNGTISGVYSTESGMPTLGVGTKTGVATSVEITEGTSPVPTAIALADVASEANLVKLVKISGVTVSDVTYDADTYSYKFTAYDGTNSINGRDKFYLYDSELGQELPAGKYDITAIVGYEDGSYVLYPTSMTAPSTDISSISTSDAAAKTLYNLNGQRVSKAGKGLYIVNGKKVVLK